MARGVRGLAIALALVPGCAGSAPRGADRAAEVGRDAERALLVRERRLGVMGTDLLVQALGEDAAALERAIDAAVAEIRRVEDLTTDWRPSPLTRLNDAAGAGPVAVPPELAALLARAREIGRLTGGAFDVGVAAVGRLWGPRGGPPRVPGEEEIARALASVGWERIGVDLAASTVELPAGASIGLGGIAKGYGVDRAIAVLREHGVEHALVSAGGDLRVLGRKRGEPWRVAVEDPRGEGRVLALLRVADASVVTSGEAARSFEIAGERYHHLLDPRTGRPSTGCASATVVAEEAAFGDGLATALCVLGTGPGLELVEALPGVEALLVDRAGAVVASSGLAADGPAPSRADATGAGAPDRALRRKRIVR